MNALRIPIVLVASAALVLSGCSTSDPGSAGSPDPTVPPGFGYEPLTSVGPVGSAVFDGASANVGGGTPPIEQVALKFSGGSPACQVRYVDPPITDEVSGQPVDVEGAAFLQVSCQPVASLGPNTDRYSSSDTENVTEVAKTGYDGSTLTLTIGLNRRAPFGGGPFVGSSTSGFNLVVVQ
jgi:hypothetical protein